MAEASDLPDDCWESIFKILKNDETNKGNCYINSLSLVSKKFLSITSSLQSSLNIYIPTTLFPHGLSKRFPNLTSLNFSRFFSGSELNEFLIHLSQFPSNIVSLNLSHQPFPVDGLKAFSQSNKTLTSLNCFNVNSIDNNHLFLIADGFPLLEELDLRFRVCNNLYHGIEALSLKLLKLRKINLSCQSYMNDQLLYSFFKNCKLLQEVIISDCYFITIAGLASALVERPTLRSLSFTHDSDHFANLFALVTNHPSLCYIEMEYKHPWRPSLCYIEREYKHPWREEKENSNTLMDFAVSPRLESLCLPNNTWLSDENILIFPSIFPNLQLLDLSYCNKISESICHVLKWCRKIRHLNLAHCSNLKLLEINFEVPELELLNLSHCSNLKLLEINFEVPELELLNLSHCSNLKLLGINFEAPKLELLNLSYTKVNNETLHLISKNCTQLREINLKKCLRVNSKIAYQMICSTHR